ncbi:hypothetical protein PSENEW3_00000471 [Picochlorum sp. SENEW3]|nr:hypothetical protein PSENEW3_00000471 [Picochlorum sp. SENEW3]
MNHHHNNRNSDRRSKPQQRRQGTRSKTCIQKSKFDTAYDEAETLQQRAERSKGKHSLELFEKSRLKYLEALQTDDGMPEKMLDCTCLLAEVEQSMAQEVLRANEALVCGTCVEDVINEAAIQNERATVQQACSLFHAAVEHYKSTSTNDIASMRVDCLNNCANTLAEWGDAVVDSDQARPLFVESRMFYEVALQKEEDSGTWSNIADMLVSHAACEASCGSGEAQSLYEKGMEAYGRACELCSSRNGDNLSALLTDWGSGILQYAEWMSEKVGRVSDAQIALEEAEKRSCHAVSFDRGSTAPHLALGDVYVAMAENCIKSKDFEKALELTRKAMGDGYDMALRIQKSCVDALIGNAEALALQAKILRMATNAEWQSVLDMAVSMYQKALESGSISGTIREKSNLFYNIACCLVGVGRIQEALHVIQVLLQAATTTVEDVMRDEDLLPLHSMLHTKA